MKSAGFRIRVEPELRELFVNACKANDLSAAQVLRTYMKRYVYQHDARLQGDLFTMDQTASS